MNNPALAGDLHSSSLLPLLDRKRTRAAVSSAIKRKSIMTVKIKIKSVINLQAFY